MCLEISRAAAPTPLIESGWKKFGGSGSALFFEMQSLGGKNSVPLDSWVKADTSVKIRANNRQDYSSGFHIYTDDSKTKGWRRVYYRRAHASGEQDGHSCVVVPEMYVASDPEAWPPLETCKGNF